MSSRAYIKLINKIQGQIDEVRQDINSMEDVNLLNFLTLTVSKILHPTRGEELTVQIDEIYNKLNQLRGKVRSALNTYAITSNTEKPENLEIQPQQDIENGESQTFLSNLLGLLEQINVLESELRGKDVKCFVGQKNEKNYRQTYDNSGNTDWEELKLKI